MRGVSLPQEPVFGLLGGFERAWVDIGQTRWVGNSHGYSDEQTSVGTTNGAGPHNVQIFVLDPDGTVLHALPGFWHAADLAEELALAQQLRTLYHDASKTAEQKAAEYARLQLAHADAHSAATVARSRWQGFDAKNERKRHEGGAERDTLLLDAAGEPVVGQRGCELKSPDRIAHERMAKLAFVQYAEFDTFAFCDYGRLYYDNNKKVDGAGEEFDTGRKQARRAEREGRRERMRSGRMLDMALGLGRRN